MLYWGIVVTTLSPGPTVTPLVTVTPVGKTNLTDVVWY